MLLNKFKKIQWCRHYAQILSNLFVDQKKRAFLKVMLCTCPLKTVSAIRWSVLLFPAYFFFFFVRICYDVERRIQKVFTRNSGIFFFFKDEQLYFTKN